MTDTELTLNQLQAVYGGATAIEYGLISRSPSALDTGTGNDRLRSYLDTGSGNDRLRIKKVWKDWLRGLPEELTLKLINNFFPMMDWIICFKSAKMPVHAASLLMSIYIDRGVLL